MILATGAMHEDGLADFADGLAGDTKERSLSIMRDHQIGTYGVIALVLSLAMRATAVTLIAEPHAVMAALIGAGAASRLSAILIMTALPPARRDGLSASVGSPTAGLAGIALWLTFMIAWLVLPFVRRAAPDLERDRLRNRVWPRGADPPRRPDRRRARRLEPGLRMPRLDRSGDRLTSEV